MYALFEKRENEVLEYYRALDMSGLSPFHILRRLVSDTFLLTDNDNIDPIAAHRLLTRAGTLLLTATHTNLGPQVMIFSSAIS